MRRPLCQLLSLMPVAASLFAQGSAPDSDPISRLDPSTLAFEPQHGYLESLLEKLKIDTSSQMLVFSKSSLQSDFITRKTPRAIYFNSDTYVGWIPGAPLIEIVTMHPTRGPIFYTLTNEKPAERTLLRAPKNCNNCHGGVAPRLFATSVFTAPSGYPRVFARSYNAIPELPLRQRWGGWYVSGQHGAQRHMGNELAVGTDERHTIDVEKGANVTDLSRYFDPKPYLSPHSDIVALMMMESQMEIQNALARVTSDLQIDSVADACEPLVEALLGRGEARLTSPVKGSGDFAAHYAATAPKDRLGRSLSELDLKTRLLKYACSPQVYSAPFDALPPAAKAQIGRRLREILSAETPEADYGYLSQADRRATLEILRDTKPGLLPD